MPTIQEIKQWIAESVKWHRHDGVLTQRINSLDIFDNEKFVMFGNPGGGAIATGAFGGTFVFPFSGKILMVGATVDVAGVTGTMQLDINNNATSILSTKITIDDGETTSRTAATPSYVSNTTFAKGDIFTFDVDTVQTTPAEGLTFFIVVTPTAY